jgi:hypothetical protein
LSLGCNGGQGHFLHEPVGVERCSALLQQAANSEAVFMRRTA